MSSEIRVPFEYRFTTFLPPATGPTLPFVIGGGTQKNPETEFDNVNNQDSSRILLGEDFIIGIVCDGCGGTHRELEEFTSSSNEVGAKLLSYLVSERARRLVQAAHDWDNRVFLDRLSEGVLSALETMAMLFCGEDEAAREHFAFDFLAATILGFVVTAENYTVFHCGDGVIAVNDEIFPLDDQQGIYLAGELAWRLCPGKYRSPVRSGRLNLFRSGPAGELRNLLLATDGLSESIATNKTAWLEFLSNAPECSANGLDFVLPEFRKRIAWADGCTGTFRDDATFLLLRRTIEPAERVTGEDTSYVADSTR